MIFNNNLTVKMDVNSVKEPFNMHRYALPTKGVIQYVYVFRLMINTSGHFNIEVPPPPTHLDLYGDQKWNNKYIP